jgi:hypothetical protein
MNAGLHLKGTPVSSKRMREHAQTAIDILEEIQGRIRKMGVMDFPKPEGVIQALGSLELGGCTNREIESLLARYIGYVAYLGPKIAEAETAYRIGAANLKRVEANLRVNLFKDNVPKAEVIARVRESEEYIELDLEQLKLFAIKHILGAHCNAYKEQAKAVSRSIELRKLEFEQEHRANNVAGHKGPAHRGGLPAGIRRRP